MLILALDLGTSSCRSALFDQRGRRLLHTTAQQTYPLHTDRDGKAELEPQNLLDAISACIDFTLTAHASDEDLRHQPITAVGTSCFLHSMLGIDYHGHPVSPIMTWADSRCREVAASLRKRYPEKAIHKKSGCMMRASFWPARLRWLAKTKPSWRTKVHRWVAPSEWLLLTFCGKLSSAHGMATGTGLYNPATRAYDAALMRIAGVSLKMLPLISDAPLQLTPSYAKRWPGLNSAVWFPGIGDSGASNLGSGATKPGFAAINVGTSAAVRVMRVSSGRQLKSVEAPFGLFCYRVDEHRHLIGGAISNAGNLRAWCLRELHLPDDPDIIEEVLSKRQTPDHGLLVLPFWSTERAPDWREDVSGSIVGITQATTALDLLQAITEASYHRLAMIIERIPDHKKLTFIVGGGIQKSRSSVQRLADVIGRSLTVLDEPEASLRGAAVFALEQLGHRGNLASVTGRTVKPDAKRVKRYAAERDRMGELEAAVFPH